VPARVSGEFTAQAQWASLPTFQWNSMRFQVSAAAFAVLFCSFLVSRDVTINLIRLKTLDLNLVSYLAHKPDNDLTTRRQA
tara:strand:+ start:978 stop:1220 length:243 start_codon:yes stop_codon:yes gene_type:complete